MHRTYPTLDGSDLEFVKMCDIYRLFSANKNGRLKICYQKTVNIFTVFFLRSVSFVGFQKQNMYNKKRFLSI